MFGVPGGGSAAEMEIAFGILGQATMLMHGHLTDDWGPPKLRKVLAALLARPKARVGVHSLVEWVWSVDEREPQDPASTFRTYSGRIGKAMRDAGVPATLRTLDGTLQVDVEPGVIDYFAFETLLKQAREHSRRKDHESACASITEALGLWQGEPLADLTSQPARDWRYAALHNVWLPANQLLLGEQIALGRLESALHHLDELQRDHRTDIGLARRRLFVLHELGLWDDLGAHHMSVRKLLLAGGDEAAAADLLAYYNALTSRKTAKPAPGARGAAERLASVPRPRSPGDETSKQRPRTLLPVLMPRGRCMLPPAVPDFVGRHELVTSLDDLARTADGAFRPGTVVLNGLAGIGKTALALHWAHRQYGPLVDTALYVDLHGFDGGRRTEAGEVIDNLLDAFEVPIARFATRARREAKLAELLTDTRTLIVLDNAANSAQVLPLWPTLSSGLVLVTSRQHLSTLASRHRARHCAVTPLNDIHAREVLTSRMDAGPETETRSLDRLTALCGGFPLALQLVAHHIESRMDTSLAQLADELADQSRLLDIGDDGDDPPANMRAALSVTYNALPPDAQTLFRLAGLSPAPELTLPAAAALSGCSAKSARRAVDALVSTHFLTHARKRGRYLMHDLLRAFARELTDDDRHTAERQGAEARLLSFYLNTSFNVDRLLFPFRPAVPMPPATPDSGSLEFVSELEATRWMLNERTNFTKLIPWSVSKNYHAFTWRIPHNLYGVYRRFGFYSDLRDAYELAVSSAQAVHDLESEGATRSDLGLIHLALGNQERALQEFHLAAAIAQQTRSAMGMAVSLAHLGTYEARVGNFERAAALYRRALTQVATTKSAAAESAMLHRFAETFRARGRHDEALDLYWQALRLREQVGNLHGVAETLIEIAATLDDRHDYVAAHLHGSRSLDIVERIFDTEVGPRACAVMASISHHQADLGPAIGYARQAVMQAARNRNSAVEADALHILGHALHDLGRSAAAEEGWQQSMTIYRDLGDQGRVQHLEHDLSSLAVASDNSSHADLPAD